MTEKTLTTENIKPALDALRGELAPWPVVAKKQDRLNTAQLNAANSGITSSLVAQIIANTAAIRALESAITGTGLRALVVASLPAVGTTGILYIVPVTTYDPDTDADVVNYSNEYIWIPVEGGTASEGHYEQVGQTGIVINNGQLTITVNGTSVGTFTANQSGDTTAAITVPTNADYVDRSTDQTVAGVKTFSDGIEGNVTGTASKAIADEDGTSIKTGYVNVAGNQTVTGDKSFTGSNTFNNILPNSTNTYSLGSSSYQWSSVYAQTYYYNGTAWGLDKANVWSQINDFKTLRLYGATSNNLVMYPPSGVKGDSSTFGFNLICSDQNLGKYAASGVANISMGQSGGTSYVALNASTIGSTDHNPHLVQIGLQIAAADNANIGSFYPSQNGGINLGTSTNQWKTLNGVNPGALSLPDLNNTIDITSTFNTSIDKTQTVNSYTADFTGWLFINWWTEGLTNPFYVYVYCTNSATDNNLLHAVWGQSFSISSNVDYMLTQFPVISGKTYWFVTNFSRASTDTKNLAYSVRNLPNLGNV